MKKAALFLIFNIFCMNKLSKAEENPIKQALYYIKEPFFDSEGNITDEGKKFEKIINIIYIDSLFSQVDDAFHYINCDTKPSYGLSIRCIDLLLKKSKIFEQYNPELYKKIENLETFMSKERCLNLKIIKE